MKKIGIILAAILLILIQILTSSNKHGAIVLVGGGEIPPQAISWLNKYVNHKTYLVISYNTENSSRWKALFNNVVFVLPEEFEKHSLDNIGAIVIDGGDQWKYLNRLNGRSIQNAHEQGIPIMGTSAGAMILGEHYFSAENGTISSEEVSKHEHKICLGKNFVNIHCLKGFLIDTHFKERNRHGRLLAFIEKSGATTGLGIDEETAICINNKEFLVLGKGTVKIINNQISFGNNSLNRRITSSVMHGL